MLWQRLPYRGQSTSHLPGAPRPMLARNVRPTVPGTHRSVTKGGHDCAGRKFAVLDLQIRGRMHRDDTEQTPQGDRGLIRERCRHRFFRPGSHADRRLLDYCAGQGDGTSRRPPGRGSPGSTTPARSAAAQGGQLRGKLPPPGATGHGAGFLAHPRSLRAYRRRLRRGRLPGDLSGPGLFCQLLLCRQAERALSLRRV